MNNKSSGLPLRHTALAYFGFLVLFDDHRSLASFHWCEDRVKDKRLETED